MAGGLTLGNLMYIVKTSNQKFKRDMADNRNEIKKFDKEVDKSGKGLDKWSNMAKTAGAALTAFGGLVITAGFKLSEFAGEAEDTQGKFDAVFKGMEKEATDFVNHFSEKFDMAESSVQEWLATLKDTFDPLGIAADQSLEWGKKLTALALDVKTFYPAINSTSDAIGRFTSYLVGNHEAVREMGVVVNETIIKNKAYEMGIANVGEELTEVQKMTARYQLLLDGLVNATGNATRELDNYNMAVEQVKEIGKETAEVYGAEVMPMFADFLKLIKSLLKWFRDLPKGMRSVIAKGTVFAGVLAAIGVIGYLPQIAAGLSMLNGAFTPFLIGGAIIAGITALVAVFSNVREEQKLTVESTRDLVDEYDKLIEKAEKTAEEKERLADITERLAKEYPGAIEGVNEETGALEINREKIIDVADAWEYYQAKLVAENRLKEIGVEIERLEELNKNIQTNIDQFDSKTIVPTVEALRNVIKGAGFGDLLKEEMSLEDFYNFNQDPEFLQSLNLNQHGIWNRQLQTLTELTQMHVEQGKQLNKNEQSIKTLNELYETQEKILNATSLEDYLEIMKEVRGETEETTKTASTLDLHIAADLDFSELEEKISQYKKELDLMNREGLDLQLKQIENQLKDEIESIKDNNKKRLQEQLDALEEERKKKVKEEYTQEEINKINEFYDKQAIQISERYAEEEGKAINGARTLYAQLWLNKVEEYKKKEVTLAEVYENKIRLLKKEGEEYELEVLRQEREMALGEARKKEYETEKTEEYFRLREEAIHEKYRQEEIEAERKKEQEKVDAALEEWQNYLDERQSEFDQYISEQERESEEARRVRQDFFDDYKQATLSEYEFDTMLLDRQYEYYNHYISDKVKLDEWYNAEKQKILEDQVNEEIQAYKDQSSEMYDNEEERINWLINKLEELAEKYLDNKVILELITAEINNLTDNTDPVLDEFEQYMVDIGLAAEEAQNQFEGWKNFIVDGLTDAITKGEDFMDTLENIADQIESMIVQKGLIEPFVNKLFGSGDGSGGLIEKGINWIASLFSAHTGGLVTVNGIETFHTGGMAGMKPLRPDEKIIKTKVGEIILNEDQQIRLINTQKMGSVAQPNVNIEVINNTGTPIKTRKEVQVDGTRTIVKMFMDGYSRNMEGIQDILRR